MRYPWMLTSHHFHSWNHPPPKKWQIPPGKPMPCHTLSLRGSPRRCRSFRRGMWFSPISNGLGSSRKLSRGEILNRSSNSCFSDNWINKWWYLMCKFEIDMDRYGWILGGLFQLCGLFLFSGQIIGCMHLFNRIESSILVGLPVFCCLTSSVAIFQTDRNDREGSFQTLYWNWLFESWSKAVAPFRGQPPVTTKSNDSPLWPIFLALSQNRVLPNLMVNHYFPPSKLPWWGSIPIFQTRPIKYPHGGRLCPHYNHVKSHEIDWSFTINIH